VALCLRRSRSKTPRPAGGKRRDAFPVVNAPTFRLTGAFKELFRPERQPQWSFFYEKGVARPLSWPDWETDRGRTEILLASREAKTLAAQTPMLLKTELERKSAPGLRNSQLHTLPQRRSRDRCKPSIQFMPTRQPRFLMLWLAGKPLLAMFAALSWPLHGPPPSPPLVLSLSPSSQPDCRQV